MKRPIPNLDSHPPCPDRTQTANLPPPVSLGRGWAAGALALLGAALLPVAGSAQTMTFTPQTQNYWTGINAASLLGAGSNSVVLKSADTTMVNLSVSGLPAGLTATWSTNSFTNSVSSGLFLAVTNAAAGYYPLSLTASGTSYGTISSNVNLFVVPEWTQTNGNSTGNWSDGTKWGGGVAPGVNDSVYFEHLIPATFTNVVDSSRSIQSLVYLGDADDAGYANALNTTINSGVTLSVLGTNGMFIGRRVSTGERPFFTFNGGGALVVSNLAANFGVVDASANSTRYLTVNMTNLYNFNATVSRFGVGDVELSQLQGAYQGSQVVNFYLAKTNRITALWADDYSAIDFNTSIQFDRNEANANNTLGNGGFGLGQTNGFFADSIGVGRGRAVGSGSSPFGFFGYPMRFANTFSNSVTPVASAYFRGTNGGRMSLLAVAVDSGLPTAAGNNRGVLDLRGGVVDMQVDQIWLAQNRTNAAANDDQAGLYFDWGNINANTVIAGNMKYTNGAAPIIGYLLVGTNGTMNVNNNLILGQTPANVTGFAIPAGSVSGQVQINNGGTLRANQVTVGSNSTNNVITINAGGTLDVTNMIASPSTMLTTLSSAGGTLTLHITGNNTLVYVTNLISSGTTATKIDLASITGISSFPVTISLIKYGNVSTPNFSGVSPGYNVAVVNNSANNSIDATISLGTPKSLLWQAYVNNSWDNETYNWLDLSTGLHTNFTTLDKVAFDDTAASSMVNITETVVPSQGAGGISLTNNLASYTFTGGGQISGSASLSENGTNSFTVDLSAPQLGVAVVRGSLLVTGNGTIGSATVSTGAFMLNFGTVSGPVKCSGSAINSGTVSGDLAVQSYGVVTNTGTVGTADVSSGGGTLSMQTNSFLCNAGLLQNIGAATTSSNSTLVNAGTIYGSTLTVNGSLIDTVQNSAGVSSGSINLATLTINGTFVPGGDAITSTKVTDYTADGNQAGYPAGRVQLNAGSKTIFKISATAAQPNTVLLSQNVDLGPSQSTKSINGCTLVITNDGSVTFAAGQTYQLFGGYYLNNMAPGNAGFNATNSYPLIQPKIPGPGLAWDLSQLIFHGILGVKVPPQVTLTNTFTLTSSNLITELAWPADYANYGWVQQQTVALTNGLSTNWVTLAASFSTNGPVDDITITNSLTNGVNTATFYRFVVP